MTFLILDHLDALTPDGGSHGPHEGSYQCPVCGAPNFKINLKSGKYGAFGCNCADTEAGKRKIRNAVAPLWQKPTRPKQKRVWSYADVQGKPVLEVCREDYGDGRRRKIWQKSLVNGKEPKELTVALYQHRECLQALDNGVRFIFWVEGEPAADALWKLGLPATTTAGGSKGYKSEIHQGVFPADHLVICPDMDQQGIKYAEQIGADYLGAKWLYANPDSYLWERLPKSGGFDVADWIENGATKEMILAAVGPRRELESPQSSPLPKLPKLSLDEILSRLQAWRECEAPDQQWQLLQDLVRQTGYSKRDLLELERNTRLRPQDVEIFTASEFSALDLGAQEFLFEGLILSNRVTILAAEAKTGKTLFVYELAHHAARGESWQGFHCPQPQRVLIVQTDESPIDCQERFRARGLDRLGDHVRLIFKFSPAMTPWLKRKCQEWGIDLVIFDSLTSIQREAGFGAKDPEYGNWLYDLKDFCAELRVTAIVTHHTNKSAVEAGLGKMAGSYSVPAAASENLMLVRPKDPSNDLERVLLRVGSRSAGSDAWHLSLSLEDFSWEYNFPCNWDGSPLDGDFTPDDQATLRENVRAYLLHHRGQFLTVEEIESVVGGKRRSIGRVCRELMTAGIVTRKPSGIGKAWAYAINLPEIPPDTVIHPPKEVSSNNQANGSLSAESQSGQGEKIDHLRDPSVINGSFHRPSNDPDSSDTAESPPLETLSDRELADLLGGEGS
ncbi:AAA family ATPase [Halomicronema sp. CCY15110]|uniref:AAA family ATPase n=1 Tax=Halomicronema sp. CCY15110 TaxID=2767773 RepID=UPI00194E7D09|nr:AAA family ATPase [Halomicronema sp. CCY15110]